MKRSGRRDGEEMGVGVGGWWIGEESSCDMTMMFCRAQREQLAGPTPSSLAAAHPDSSRREIAAGNCRCSAVVQHRCHRVGTQASGWAITPPPLELQPHLPLLSPGGLTPPLPPTRRCYRCYLPVGVSSKWKRFLFVALSTSPPLRRDVNDVFPVWSLGV